MAKTLYNVMHEHADIENGVWTFRASGNAYANGLLPGGQGHLVLVPIIDDIERADQRMAGALYDVYAMVLKREGLLS